MSASSDSMVYGGDGNDDIRGGAGADKLYSAGATTAANDAVYPADDMGAEHDRISAGDGNDIVGIGYGDDADGGAGSDTLALSLGGAAAGVVLNTGSLTGATPITLYGGVIQGFEILGSVRGTEFADTITATTQTTELTVNGGGGDDVLIATGSAVTLQGGEGNDRLVSGSAADVLDGGAGIDTADYSAAVAGVAVQLSTGTGTASDGDRLRSIENVVGSGSNDILKGSSSDNALSGGAGDDRLEGGLGNDMLDGGSGIDSLAGGAGDDTYKVDVQSDLVFENANEGTDTVITSAGFYLYANIENLTLATGAGDIFGVGNELANAITGNEGSNLLIAGAGADVVHGGAGVDSLFGQDGNDQLFGDAGIDYLVGGAGDDMLDGGTDADALYGEDGNDVLWGGTDFQTDILVGGAGNDVLHGDSGLGDYDLMDGGSGDDTYYVDTPADLTFEAVGGGTDTVHANIVGAGYYLYANVENLILDGVTPFGVGNELNNQLTGNAIGNYLLGGAGDDILNGKAGNDVLFGEAGADTFVFEHGTGADVIGDFAAGTDKIDLSAIGYTWQQVQNSLHENGGNTAIDLGGGDLIVLNGVTIAQLHASDFILAGSGPTTGALGVEGFQVDGGNIDTLKGAVADSAPFASPWFDHRAGENAIFDVRWHDAATLPIDTATIALA